MSEDETDLRQEFIEVCRRPSEVSVRVRTIHWHGPHTPCSRMITYCTLSQDATDEQVEEAVEAALSDSRYFGTCGRCMEKQPMGWMHTESMCQSCAERHLGVVY